MPKIPGSEKVAESAAKTGRLGMTAAMPTGLGCKTNGPGVRFGSCRISHLQRPPAISCVDLRAEENPGALLLQQARCSSDPSQQQAGLAPRVEVPQSIGAHASRARRLEELAPAKMVCTIKVRQHKAKPILVAIRATS